MEGIDSNSRAVTATERALRRMRIGRRANLSQMPGKHDKSRLIWHRFENNDSDSQGLWDR